MQPIILGKTQAKITDYLIIIVKSENVLCIITTVGSQERTLLIVVYPKPETV